MKTMIMTSIMSTMIACAGLPLAKEEMEKAEKLCLRQKGLSSMDIGTRMLTANCNNGMKIVFNRTIGKKTIEAE